MAKNCCICGHRLGILGEERYKITEEYVACYQCAPLFREMKESDNLSQLLKLENELRTKLNTEDVPEEVRKAVENEIQKIKESKQHIHKQEQKMEEIKLKRKDFMITTGYNFEGYRIVKYIDLVHGEIVLGTGFYSELAASVSDLLGTTSRAFEGKVSQAKHIAQEQMIINAMTVEANAIIGVDFDIATFSNNMIGVSTNGTAVVIEKID